MGEITRVGVDLAKRVIQVHAVDATGRVIVAKQLQRDGFIAWCAQLPPGCLVAMEACSGVAPLGTTAARDGHGGEADRAALRLALSTERQDRQERRQPTRRRSARRLRARSMRFVPVKSVEQQSMMALHRLREGYKEERTACINRIRGLLAEFGLVFAQRPEVLRAVLVEVSKTRATSWARSRAWRCSVRTCTGSSSSATSPGATNASPGTCAATEQAKAAAKLCGIGPVTASALVATVDDFKQFKNGRAVRRLDGPGAQAELERRQEQCWASITKRGDDLPANAPDPGRQVGGVHGAPTQRSPVAMDRPAARARRLAEGRGRVGQQKRAHPVVDTGQRPELRSGTRSDQAPNAIAGSRGRLK